MCFKRSGERSALRAAQGVSPSLAIRARSELCPARSAADRTAIGGILQRRARAEASRCCAPSFSPTLFELLVRPGNIRRFCLMGPQGAGGGGIARNRLAPTCLPTLSRAGPLAERRQRS